MGALFSSDNQSQQEEERRRQSVLEYQKRREERIVAEVLRRKLEEQRLQVLYTEQRRRQQCLKEQIKKKQQLHSFKIIHQVPNNGYELIPLHASSAKYIELKKMFSKTGKWFMKVSAIESVNNPIQKALYELKKAEAQRIYRESKFQEVYLYHGTKAANLDAICRVNLDRRKCVLHKFGYGVSFSPFSYYASHYCDKQKKPELDKRIDKKMLVCRVIAIKATLGDSFTRVPENGCDYTTSTERGDVMVKYDDDTYYPEYVITFRVNRKSRKMSAVNANNSQAQLLNSMLENMKFTDSYFN